jgi:hypothetical protein
MRYPNGFQQAGVQVFFFVLWSPLRRSFFTEGVGFDTARLV